MVLHWPAVSPLSPATLNSLIVSSRASFAVRSNSKRFCVETKYVWNRTPILWREQKKIKEDEEEDMSYQQNRESTQVRLGNQ